MADAQRVHVVGYGAVAKSLLCCLRTAVAAGRLPWISGVAFWDPMITEASTDGFFSFQHCKHVVRETLVEVLDGLRARPGDILIELACRIDTLTLWQECKARGLHFCNTAFDMWADQELDLDCIDNLRRAEVFSPGVGPTTVFAMGMNPGIVNHFVSHGLKCATGLTNPREAARAFQLRAIIFSERDTQRPIAGSEAEAQLAATQLEVLYNTWSPQNFSVETAESKLLWPGLPEEAAEIMADAATLVGWCPAGPTCGFAPPHDECFTCQRWFDLPVPALFVYEPPPSARAFLLGPNFSGSTTVPSALLIPSEHQLDPDSYDMLGVVLLSKNREQLPMWCGVCMRVSDAAVLDPTGECGPTSLQVAAGVWTGLQYIQHRPAAGDCFPEDVPTDFVLRHAFPWTGELLVRPCPEALAVPGFFDPSLEDAGKRVLGGVCAADRIVAAPVGVGKGVRAAHALLPGAILQRLAPGALPFRHSCSPNAYMDRNSFVRTLRRIGTGEEVTLDYALLPQHLGSDSEPTPPCCCMAPTCRRVVSGWTGLPAAERLRLLSTLPLPVELELEAGPLSPIPSWVANSCEVKPSGT
eukprot:EG_transcript_5317